VTAEFASLPLASVWTSTFGARLAAYTTEIAPGPMPLKRLPSPKNAVAVTFDVVNMLLAVRVVATRLLVRIVLAVTAFAERDVASVTDILLY
jgi:hypothetical protein